MNEGQMNQPREPVPAQLEHGTIVQLNGRNHPSAVGLRNPLGHAMAYEMPKTPSGKRIHRASASIDIRTGGTVDANDIEGVRKGKLTMREFLAMLDRGHRDNIQAGHYTDDEAQELSRIIEEGWPREESEK